MMPSRPLRALVRACATTAVAAWLVAVPAHPAETDACRALADAPLTVEDRAAVAIASARSVAASDRLPAHCAVSGFVAPQVGFELRLPLERWNGRFLQQGCRGLCGYIPIDATGDALARGYAVAATDMGHKGANSQSAIWAADDPQARIDFGHRATHVTALASQALVARFYGRKPVSRLFRGCGTGGRQGLVSAQRHPEDFDGIIADGGIVFSFTKSTYLIAWSVLANRDAAGRQIMSPDDLRVLHGAVMESCDALDGERDGLLAQPQLCRFDPASLRCGEARRSRAGADAACLTDEKIAVARKMYAGPADAAGRSIHPGMAFGSELRWSPAFFGAEPRYARFAAEIMRYLLQPGRADPDFQLEDFDLGWPPERFAEAESVLGADSTDYRAFKARGGRILALHGWNESAMPGTYPVRYHERLVADSGGPAAAGEFFRLYMVPGEMHCTSGIPEGMHFDSLTLMERWLEQGAAPQEIRGFEVKVEPKLPDQVRFPIAPEAVKGERSFLPHPTAPRPQADPG